MTDKKDQTLEGSTLKMGDDPARAQPSAPDSSRWSVERMKPVLKTVIQRIERSYDRAARAGGIPTGVSLLDRRLGGLQPGELVLIAGRPSTGPTSLALTWVANTLPETSALLPQEAVPTLIFSLDHSREEVCTRLLTQQSGVEAKKLREGDLETRDWVQITKAASVLAEARLHVNDTPDLRVEELCAAARLWRGTSDSPALVVVDAVDRLEETGALAGSGQGGWRHIGAALKELAVELHAAVVAVVGLPPPGDAWTGEAPMLSEVRPRALERVADVVAFLHREELHPETARSRKTGVTDIIVAKHPCGYLAVEVVLLRSGRFVNLASRKKRRARRGDE